MFTVNKNREIFIDFPTDRAQKQQVDDKPQRPFIPKSKQNHPQQQEQQNDSQRRENKDSQQSGTERRQFNKKPKVEYKRKEVPSNLTQWQTRDQITRRRMVSVWLIFTTLNKSLITSSLWLP